jgi:glycosyltransferase involved in cell wall biosynthesis
LAQTYSNCEIIVVDQSTDNTREVLAPYLDRITYRYQNSRGVSVARNEGIRLAKGQLVAFLDADDTWLPDKIALQVAAFRLHPEAGLCFTDFSSFDQGGVRKSSCLDVNLQAWMKSHPCASEWIFFGRLYIQMLDHNCVHTSTIVARKDALESAGLFDETFTVCEDYDLWLRIARHYPLLGVNRTLCGYRYQPYGLSGPLETRGALWNLNNIRVLQKHLRNHWIPREHLPLTNHILNHRSYFGAWTCFNQNNFREARELFLRCGRHQPFQLRHWIYFLASMLPPRVIDTIRSSKRGLQTPTHPSVQT